MTPTYGTPSKKILWKQCHVLGEIKIRRVALQDRFQISALRAILVLGHSQFIIGQNFKIHH